MRIYIFLFCSIFLGKINAQQPLKLYESNPLSDITGQANPSWIQKVADQSDADISYSKRCNYQGCSYVLSDDTGELARYAGSEKSQIFGALARIYAKKLDIDGYAYQPKDSLVARVRGNGVNTWHFGLGGEFNYRSIAVKDDFNPPTNDDDVLTASASFAAAKITDKWKSISSIVYNNYPNFFTGFNTDLNVVTVNTQLDRILTPHWAIGANYRYEYQRLRNFDGAASQLGIGTEINAFPMSRYFSQHLVFGYRYYTAESQNNNILPRILIDLGGGEHQLYAKYFKFWPKYYLSIAPSVARIRRTVTTRRTLIAELSGGVNVTNNLWLSAAYTYNGYAINSSIEYNRTSNLIFGLNYYFGKGQNIVNPRFSSL